MTRRSTRELSRRQMRRLNADLDRTLETMSVRYEPEPPFLPESVLLAAYRALIAGLDAPAGVVAGLRARVTRSSRLANTPWRVGIAPESLPHLTDAQRGHLTTYTTDHPDAMRRACALVAAARGHR